MYPSETPREQMHAAMENQQPADQLTTKVEEAHRNLKGMIRILEKMVELKDPYTAGHQQNVAAMAVAIGRKMGLTADRLESIELAGAIHDIGKIGIPTDILCKPGRLSNIEMMLVQEHAAHGFLLLQGVSFTWPLAEIVHQHHERVNGSGYPRGLAGKEMMVESKIVAVADVFDAMASHRPYRPALGEKAALEELRKNKGVLYDTQVVNALEAVLGEAQLVESKQTEKNTGLFRFCLESI
ncbi:HD-GYP domain-containing protein [Anoxynatronum sibiricum]|uniref:HD-GYP domain-containing protein n=1 Tax=Anoxynatronum sibiricum TaxID=210623 RepID=A0ABU9VVG0_9CLOT